MGRERQKERTGRGAPDVMHGRRKRKRTLVAARASSRPLSPSTSRLTSIDVHLGIDWLKARFRHDTTRNILVSDWHDLIFRTGFGLRLRPMGGHEHGPFKTDTKWLI
jgi:hypothetical protein